MRDFQSIFASELFRSPPLVVFAVRSPEGQRTENIIRKSARQTCATT